MPLFAFAWPPSLETALLAINRVYRTALRLPDQASTFARQIDALHYFEITVFTAIAVLYFGTAIYFVLRYRRRSEHDYAPEVRAPGLVTTYTFGMLGLFMVFWLLGDLEYRTLRTPPAGATDVYVVAKQWMWKFAYADGGASVGVMYVPVGQPIRLLITSRDVIHSFFVPAFRLKQDAVPGTYTTAWFEVRTPGTYQILCAQMCGAGHSRMWGQVVALGADDYERWRRGTLPGVSPASVGVEADAPGVPSSTESPVDAGRRAATEFACVKCHTLDGQPHIGPTWLGLFGSEEPLENGGTVTVDEAYITRSMMDPTADVVRGFQPVMPSYQGIVSPADTAAIVEFIKSLRDVKQPHVVAPLPTGPITITPSHPRGAGAAPDSKGGGAR